MQGLELEEQTALALAQTQNAERVASRERILEQLAEVRARLEPLEEGQQAAISEAKRLRKGAHAATRGGLAIVGFLGCLMGATNGWGRPLYLVVALQWAAIWWLGDKADREAMLRG